MLRPPGNDVIFRWLTCASGHPLRVPKNEQDDRVHPKQIQHTQRNSESDAENDPRDQERERDA